MSPMTIDPFASDVVQALQVRRRGRPDVAERNRAQSFNANPERRALVLAFIEAHIAANVNAPTIREIVEGCGLSSTSIAVHYVNAMLHDGALIRTGDGARSYTTPRALEAVRVAYETAHTGGEV